jgi:tetratricopeptide (TPR) repeat protein
MQGVEHSDTLKVRNNLALALNELGDLMGARKLYEEVLEIRERVLGVEHPETSTSAWNLLLTVRALNDSETAAHLINKLRWLLDRDEDSVPSAVQRTIRRELLDLLGSS